jgi:hypothetical protein
MWLSSFAIYSYQIWSQETLLIYVAHMLPTYEDWGLVWFKPWTSCLRSKPTCELPIHNYKIALLSTCLIWFGWWLDTLPAWRKGMCRLVEFAYIGWCWEVTVSIIGARQLLGDPRRSTLKDWHQATHPSSYNQAIILGFEPNIS